MKTFIIHRHKKKSEAKRQILELAKSNKVSLDLIFLKKSYGEEWKTKAETIIYDSEIVILFDPEDCEESENAKWEIDVAKRMGKKIVSIIPYKENDVAIDKLKSKYELAEEFESHFDKKNENHSSQINDLYRIMIDSSEKLIQRRQITNGFFITVIGGIVTASGFIIKENPVGDANVYALLLPTLVGIFLCRSWGNLIKNYGRLNAAKFRVILRLEEELRASVFSAEWVALGKGLRPKKYRSFTDTEQHVPNMFMVLFIVFAIYLIWNFNWCEIINFPAELYNWLFDPNGTGEIIANLLK
ncbi:MAG: hypothetical protein K9G33_16220 [Sneathiella sp.]|nr:hypothetical protein [Sneathiella sp.]